jgi:HEAT repeat protein
MKVVITTLAALLLAVPVFAQTQRASNPDEELALAALEGLMQQSPARAVPIIKKVLAGSQTKLVKQRALFVLSQIEGPEAAEILLQTARSTDAEMRDEAIRSIGIGGDPKSLDALKPLYTAGDKDIRKRVLEAWMIAEHKDAVYQIAVNAKSEEEAAEAIRMLGVMGASEELRKLGDRPNAAKGLIEAYALSGDLASLRKFAEGPGEKSMRLHAVRQIGIIRGDPPRAALREIYTRATDAEIKEAALQGMLIADDDKGVLALYQASKDADEKRKLLRTLMSMDGEAALQVIDAALETK